MEEKDLNRETGFNLENTYINLPNIMYSKQYPSDVRVPKIAIFNSSLAKELGLNEEYLNSKEGAEILSGNKVIEGTTPIAQAYAGHQFGYFTMLGDGRAVLLGEIVSKSGERYDVQLKGSGKTKYSRGGDGKASLGPMLREYIISEAMEALNIPTTRSLAVTTTGEKVVRENLLEGAVLTRIAKSHIRVGTFQYVRQWGTTENLKSLADYTIERHYKDCFNEENPYVALLNEVIKKQAELISKWQLVGFVHGVMNTDNMTISGETIDYGPCAFMDTYDTETVFSSIDLNGRYAYGNQPSIGIWNLARFAEALLPLLSDNSEEAIKLAEKSISNYNDLFIKFWNKGMREKIGLFNEEAEDEHLIEALLSMMKKYEADFTNTFRALTLGELKGLKLFTKDEFKDWYNLWQERLEKQSESREEAVKLMERSNPIVIPRNHRVEEALEAATSKGDYTVMNSLLEVLRKPYDYSNVNEYYAELPLPTACKYRTYCGT